MVDATKGKTSRGTTFYRCGSCKAKYMEEERAEECCNKTHAEIFEEVVGGVLQLSLYDAIADGGLWTDGTFLWFRQTRLCRLKKVDQ